MGYGAAMYELQQQLPAVSGPASPPEKEAEGGGLAVRRLWGRDDVSCGTSIPLIAEGQPGESNSTTYCVGAYFWGFLVAACLLSLCNPRTVFVGIGSGLQASVLYVTRHRLRLTGMPRGAKRWHLLAFDTDTGADRFQYRYYPEGKQDCVKNFFANPVKKGCFSCVATRPLVYCG